MPRHGGVPGFSELSWLKEPKEMKETMSSRVNPLHYRAASFVVVYVALIDRFITSFNGGNIAFTVYLGFGKVRHCSKRLRPFIGTFYGNLIPSGRVFRQSSKGKWLALRYCNAHHGRTDGDNNPCCSTVNERLTWKSLA
jgi:hypothetical protein